MNIRKLVMLAFLTMMMVVSCKEKKHSKELTIVLDWTPNTNHTGLFVAQKKGYFKELGLPQVTIIQPPEGSTTTLIAAGKAEFGISFQDTLAKAFAQQSPFPVTAVAAIIEHNTSGVISLAKKGIERPKQMEGFRYATWEDEIEQAILKKIITDDGGSFSDIILIPNAITDVLTALQTDIDLVWIYYAWDGIATELANLKTNFFYFADYAEELDFYTPVIIANNDYLKNNPTQTKKMLAAIKKGYQYAMEHPHEAAEILVEFAPELDLALVKASQEWLKDKYHSAPTDWGKFEAQRWNSFYQWLFDNQLIDREIPINFGFSNEFIKE